MTRRTSPDAGWANVARSAPMGKPASPELETASRTVYRAKGARLYRFTMKAALRDAARIAFWQRHLCDCERAQPEYHSTTGVYLGHSGGHDCGLHEQARVVSERLARLWLHRLRRGDAK